MSDSPVTSPSSDPSAVLNLSDLLLSLNLSIAEDSILNTRTMSVQHFDVKNLSIVPTFDGNPTELNQFLTVSSILLNHYYDRTPANVGCIQNLLLLHGLLGKLTGRAREVVSVHGYTNWDDIKNTLIQHFGDQRNENSLTRDLVNLKQQPNETPLNFYEKCMGILSTITNYVDLHNEDETIIRSKKEFFKQQALTTFLAGLREPLGSTIRAMRPVDLATAIQYIQEENNIRYLQRGQTQQTSFHQIKSPSAPKSTYQHPPQQFSYPTQFAQTQQPQQSTWRTPQHAQQATWRPQQTYFPRGPINVQPRANPPQQRYPTNQQVFGKPNNAWAPKNNQQNLPKPTPMSTTTRNTFANIRRPNFTQQSKPTFTSEELFNLEQDQLAEGSSNDYYNNYYDESTMTPENETVEEQFDYAEDQNFQEDANQTHDT